MAKVTEHEFCEMLQGLFECEDAPDELKNARVMTFGEAGLLTRNKGLVVRLADGAEFQVTVT